MNERRKPKSKIISFSAFSFISLASFSLKSFFRVKYLLLIAVFAVTALPSMAQENPDDARLKLTEFLKTNAELRDYSKNGYTSTFTGEFRSLPDELQAELKSSFPDRNFYIARMKVLIDPPYKDFDLILITNSATNDVTAFAWAKYWMIRPSTSFSNVLTGQYAKSKDDSIAHVKSLARLIAVANGFKTGAAKVRKGKVTVELRNKNDRVTHLLEVKIDKKLRFEGLRITEPNGDGLRTFV